MGTSRKKRNRFSGTRWEREKSPTTDFCVFEASLIHMASSRTSRARQWDPVSRKPKAEEEQKSLSGWFQVDASWPFKPFTHISLLANFPHNCDICRKDNNLSFGWHAHVIGPWPCMFCGSPTPPLLTPSTKLPQSSHRSEHSDRFLFRLLLLVLSSVDVFLPTTDCPHVSACCLLRM